MIRQRLLATLLALAVVASAFAVVLTPAGAEDNAELSGVGLDAEIVNFPWVPNGAMVDGTGPWYGTITVQNLEEVPVDYIVQIGTDIGSDSYSELIEEVAPFASITLSTETLGVGSPGEPVRVWGFTSNTVLVDEEQQIFVDAGIPARITGVMKEASPDPSFTGKTTENHTIVDGYTGLTGGQVQNGRHVLPIAQTNDGWNTVIRTANFHSSDSLAPVTITLYQAASQGGAGESVGSFTRYIRGGEVTTFDLSELGVGEGWVGSAYLSANVPMASVAERVKSETDMMIKNVSRPESEAHDTEQYAALVFKEYNYWNTGISIANTHPTATNTVQVTIYGRSGSPMWTEHRNIPPRAMEFVYLPGTGETTLDGFVGSAVISGSHAFHAAVDQVKYFGTNDVGNAMSYIVDNTWATGPREEDGVHYKGDMLALPFFQKGNAISGFGDNSGIQLFNASTEHSVTGYLRFYDATGALVGPTLFQPKTVTLLPRQHQTIYSQENLGELPSDFQGSVVIEVDGKGKLVGVSNNVNYEVQGDGSAAFNMVTIPRGDIIDPVPGQPYQIIIDPDESTNMLDEEAPAVGAPHTVTVTVLDYFGDPVLDQDVHIRVDGNNVEPRELRNTGGTGSFEYTYHGEVEGTDTIVAWIGGENQQQGDVFGTALKHWVPYQELTVDLRHADEAGIVNGDLAVNPVGTEHTVISTVYLDGTAVGANEADVMFEIIDGPHDGQFGDNGLTNQDGEVSFSYTGHTVGIDTIQVTASLETADGVLLNATSNVVYKQWIDEILLNVELEDGDILQPFSSEAELTSHNGVDHEWNVDFNGRWMGTFVTVTDGLGNPIPGAEVTHERLNVHITHENDGWCPDLIASVASCGPSGKENPWTAYTDLDGEVEGLFQRGGPGNGAYGEVLLQFTASLPQFDTIADATVVKAVDFVGFQIS